MESNNSSASTSDPVKPELDALLTKMTEILEQVKQAAITLSGLLKEPNSNEAVKALKDYTKLLEQFKNVNEEYLKAKQKYFKQKKEKYPFIPFPKLN